MQSKLRKAHRWNMADTVTSVRMAGSLFLLFLPLKSIWFSGVYTFTGFASLHTWLNKLTGMAVFLLPYVLFTSSGVMYSWAVCILAFAASSEELVIHLLQTDYLADRKSLFPIFFKRRSINDGMHT